MTRIIMNKAMDSYYVLVYAEINIKKKMEKIVVTLNITDNHCFADGYLLSKAFNLIQEYFNKLTGIIKVRC